MTLEMGGVGGEFLPPLEAPQGAGYLLTAAAVTARNHVKLGAAVTERSPGASRPVRATYSV